MGSFDGNLHVMSLLSLLSSFSPKIVGEENMGSLDGNLDTFFSLSLSLMTFLRRIICFLFSPARLFKLKGENESVRGIGGE